MLRLYNSLNRKKQTFKALKGKDVTIYSCGPTVYDYAHIGNFRSYLNWDVLVRYLKYIGYKTKVVKNITDVGHFTDDNEDSGEDKFEKAARKEKKKPLELAQFYIKAFKSEEKRLNILPPDNQPRATKEIEMIQKIITGLLKKGYAYDAKDGVYFDISKFPSYGKLSGNTPKKVLAGARVKVNPNKKHPADFALWKKKVGENRKHTLYWPSPWGDGFPGWHIECTAMALRYLGKTIDIHSGGKDNKFPHHESEIAQSEAYTGKSPFSRFWLHSNHVDVNNKKMSKSLNNFYTLQNIIDKGFDPLAYRFWVLSAHYRSPMNFTWEGLEEASGNWKKIVEFYTSEKDLTSLSSSGLTRGSNKIDSPVKPGNDKNIYIKSRDHQFTTALDDDLNTPKAIAILLQIIKDANKDPKKIPAAKNLIKKWDQVLGILPSKMPEKKNVMVPSEVKKLFNERQKARKIKDFKKADSLRKKIEKAGYSLVDNPNGNSRLLPKK